MSLTIQQDWFTLDQAIWNGVRPDSERLLSELLNEVAYTYFPLRAADDAMTSRFGRTTAEWGLVRSLDEKGPMTIATLARSRPVARQWIQRLANQLTKDGLIELVDNPDHRRAKLMLITPAGQKLLRRIGAANDVWVGAMERGFDTREIHLTLGFLRKLRKRLTTEFNKADPEARSGLARLLRRSQ